jgi:pimeloyl-ACP methyl ester carboxylesterase
MQKGPDNLHGVDPSAFEEMAAHLAADRAHFFAGFFKSFYGDGLLTHPVSDEVLEWSRQIAMQASLKATLACANAFATTDFREDMDAFRVPTLIVHGTADKTVPIDATARRAAKAIARSRLIEYDGAPHGLLATDRARLIPDLLAFLLA